MEGPYRNGKEFIMPRCYQCDDGKWVCGENVGDDACHPQANYGDLMGDFTVSGAKLEVYLKRVKKDEEKEKFVVYIVPV